MSGSAGDGLHTRGVVLQHLLIVGHRCLQVTQPLVAVWGGGSKGEEGGREGEREREERVV